MQQRLTTLGRDTARHVRARDAWTAYWQEPGSSHCTSGAPAIWEMLAAHWSSFARALRPGDRVLDLGCGAGAVARFLLATRGDTHVTGVDFARLPFVIDHQVELLSDTAMESLPFADASFAAAVSQFGFEYGQTSETVAELARVLVPRARLSLLVHRADSSIAIANRRRLQALSALFGAEVRDAFCAGDALAFGERMRAMAVRFPDDALVVECSRALPLRLSRSQRERIAIWDAVEQAIAPEFCLAQALDKCSVAEDAVATWLAPLRAVFDLAPISILREHNGLPLAWIVQGRRRD